MGYSSELPWQVNTGWSSNKFIIILAGREQDPPPPQNEPYQQQVLTENMNSRKSLTELDGYWKPKGQNKNYVCPLLDGEIIDIF